MKHTEKFTYVVSKDKDGKIISIQSMPIPSSMDKLQRSCEEHLSSFVLTVLALTTVLLIPILVIFIF